MFLSIKNYILLLVCCICIVSCTETNKKDADTSYVDIMKSEALTDEALEKSWNLLIEGQQLADEGKSIDDIVKTFPKGTLVSTNKDSILFFIDGSIPMSIELNSNQKKQYKGGSENSVSPPKFNIPQRLSIRPLATTFNDDDKLVDVIASDKNDDERQYKKALILAPFIEEFGKNDDALISYEYLKKNRNYQDNIVFRKESLTLEDFTNFDKYDLIHLSTHGINYCTIKTLEGIDENKVPIFDVEEYTKSNCILRISTGISHGFKDLVNNEKERDEFREKYNKYRGHIIITKDKIKIKHTFFSHIYNKKMDNKILIISACETGQNGVLASVIKNIMNNSHFLYWQNSVYPNDAYVAFNKFYENLVDKGLDVAKAYDKIPLKLRVKLPSDGEYYVNKDTVKYKTTTSLEHLQTGNPRHAIEVIDMLNPTNNSLIQTGDFYKLVGEFDDGKDEALILKVKLIGYTKAEFLEEKMSISLLIDDENVLSKQSFLPDVSGDNSTVKSIKDHKYGVIVTFTDIAIPDVGTKEELTLKAILHLNDEHISIHKETVSILSYGIIATTERRGRKSKFTYDSRRKTGKYEMGSLPVVYHDDEGYKYINSRTSGWKKVNMRKMTGTNSNFDARTRTLLNFPLVGYALIFKMSDIQKVSEYSETKVECGLPAKCTQFSTSNGVKLLYNGSGRLIEYTTPSQTINFQYGNYNVILPEAGIPKKVKKLEDVMSGTEAVQK